MAADNNYPILLNKIAYHGIKTKPDSVVVSQADPHSTKLDIAEGSFRNIQLGGSA